MGGQAWGGWAREAGKGKYKCGEMVREPREPAGHRFQGSADMGLCRGSGKENGNYYLGFRV